MSRVRYPDEAPRRGASAAASRARARDAAIDDSRDRGNDRGADRARAKPAQKAGGLPLRLAHWALRNPAASGGALVSTVMVIIIVANAFANQASKHPSPFFATRDRVAEAARASAASRSADPTGGEAQTLPRPKPNPAEIALVQSLQQALKDRGLYQGAVDGIAGPATQDAIRAFEKQVGLVPTGEPSERLLAALKALAARTRQSALAPGTQGASGSEADAAPAQPVQQVVAQPAPPAAAVTQTASAGARASSTAAVQSTAHPATGTHSQAAAAKPAAQAPATTGSIKPPSEPLAADGDDRVQKIQRALIATGYGPLKADGRMDARTKEQIRRYEVAHGWPATGQISDRLILDLLVTAVTR